MLSFAAPWALWLALALLPALALYFLRTRFNRRPTGSVYIWSRLARPVSGGSRPRPRSLLLLALQLLVVILAAVSASGPRLVETRISKPGTAFLIDVSASMAARDLLGARPGVVDRVDYAAGLLAEELAALPEGSPAALFACSGGLRPLGEAGDQPAALAARAGSLECLDEGFAEARVASELSAWLAARGESWRVVLFTDGGLDLGGEVLSRAAGGALRVVTVGASGRGLGIGRLRLEGDKARFQAWNGFERSRTAGLSLERNGETVAEGQVELAPGWSSGELPLPSSVAQRADGSFPPGWYQLELSGGAEGGPPAGAACRLAVYEPPGLVALLVGRAHPYLLAALEREGVSLRLRGEFPPELDRDEIAIAVADGVAAPAGLACDLLSFGPAGERWPVQPGPVVSGTIAPIDQAHPLLRFVDWAGAQADGATSLETGTEASALAEIGGMTVLAAWEENGYERLACGIDLSNSDLCLSPAFPILIANFIARARPSADAQTAYTIAAGEIAYRAEPASFESGQVEAGRRGGIVGLRPPAAGFYPWSRGPDKGFIAADAPLGELDASPRRLRSPDASPGDGGMGPAGGASAGDAPASYERRIFTLTPFFLAALVLALAAEWILWRGLPRSAKEERT